jgi:hypothetical protein
VTVAPPFEELVGVGARRVRDLERRHIGVAVPLVQRLACVHAEGDDGLQLRPAYLVEQVVAPLPVSRFGEQGQRLPGT